MNIYFTPSVLTLSIWHILAHIALICFIFIGSVNEWLVAILLYFIQATVGGTVIFHRLLGHKSFESPSWFTKIGTIVGSLGGNGSGLAWAAVHREHHRFTDTNKDPHCPHHKGIFFTQFMTFMHSPNLRYVPDLLRDKFQLFVHEYYWIINLSYILLLSLIDVRAVLYAYFIPALLTWHGGSFINTIGHNFGYRNYDTKDSSRNNFLTGLLVSGEGWHNNHHADPKNSNFGHKWYEIDIGYQLIKLVRIK